MSDIIRSPFGGVVVSPNEPNPTGVIDRVFRSNRQRENYAIVPPVDVYETAESYHIYLDLPGVRKEDIEVSYNNGAITVNAESKGINRSDGHWVRHERRIGPYLCNIPLNQTVDPAQINAHYNDGILELVVTKPKADASSAVAIEVT